MAGIEAAVVKETWVGMVVCADVGNGMTFISLRIVVVVFVVRLMDLGETGTCGIGTATK